MDLALLVLRLILGLGFAAHGAQKLFGVFGGGGIEGTAATFEKGGLRPGRLHATSVGITELSSGLLIAVGLGTPFAASALIAVMTVAVLTVHVRNGFFNSNNGFEYNLLLAGAAFSLAGIGPGAWSLDAALGLDLAGTLWAIATLFAGLGGGILIVLWGRAVSHAQGKAGPAGLRPPNIRLSA